MFITTPTEVEGLYALVKLPIPPSVISLVRAIELSNVKNLLAFSLSCSLLEWITIILEFKCGWTNFFKFHVDPMTCISVSKFLPLVIE